MARRLDPEELLTGNSQQAGMDAEAGSDTQTDETTAAPPPDTMAEGAPDTAASGDAASADSTEAEQTSAVEPAPAAEPPPAPAPAVTPPPEADEVARLLAAAEADIEARRLTSPVGNNAWEKYQRVLGLSPAHPEAMAGMERVIGSYLELFGAALEQEDFEQAESYLTRIRDLHPDSPALQAGRQRLDAASAAREERLAEQERQRQAEEAARRAELERQRVAQAVQGHWESFESALTREDLDEAERRLAQVRGLDPEESGLAMGEKRLAQARESAAAKARQYVGEMVDIPAGSFRMGDMSGEGGDSEKPVHSVTVPAFKLGKHEVTVGQFQRFVEATGYRTDAERNADGNAGCRTYTGDGWDWTAGASWRNPGFSVGDDHPVVCISWNDVEAYVEWLSTETGERYRLPTEAEWEYAARAGSSTKYHFGNSESQLCRYANHADTSTDFSWRNETCSDGVGMRTAVVGRYEQNRFGLHDMHGNVWEWVQDCWNGSYVGAPADGRGWTSGDCSLRVVRGGSWYHYSRYLRSAYRGGDDRSHRYVNIGFRLAQDK